MNKRCVSLAIVLGIAILMIGFAGAVWNTDDEANIGWHPSEDIKVDINGVATSLQAFADKNFNASAELEAWSEENHADIGWHNAADIKVNVGGIGFLGFGESAINTSLQSYIDNIVIMGDEENSTALEVWNDEEHGSWHTGGEIKIRIRGADYSVQEAINMFMISEEETGAIRYFDSTGRYLAVYHPEGWESLIVPNADIDTGNAQEYSAITCGADNYVVVGIRYKKVSNPLNIGTDRTDGVSLICGKLDANPEDKKIFVTDEKVNIKSNLDFNLRGPLIATDNFAGYNPRAIPSFINDASCAEARGMTTPRSGGVAQSQYQSGDGNCMCLAGNIAMGQESFCTLSAEYMQTQQNQLAQAQLGTAISSISGIVPQIAGGLVTSLANAAPLTAINPALSIAYLIVSNFMNIGGAIGQELIDNPENKNAEINLTCGAGEVVGGISYKDYWEHGCVLGEKIKGGEGDCSRTCTGCTEDDVDGFRVYCVEMKARGTIDYSDASEEFNSDDVSKGVGGIRKMIGEVINVTVEADNKFMCPNNKIMVGIAWKDIRQGKKDYDMLDGATPLCVEYYPFR